VIPGLRCHTTYGKAFSAEKGENGPRQTKTRAIQKKNPPVILAWTHIGPQGNTVRKRGVQSKHKQENKRRLATIVGRSERGEHQQETTLQKPKRTKKGNPVQDDKHNSKGPPNSPSCQRGTEKKKNCGRGRQRKQSHLIQQRMRPHAPNFSIPEKRP